MTEAKKPPDAIIQKIRRGRWTTALIGPDWSPRDIQYWPTKSAAKAWLCIRLDKYATILECKPPLGSE